MPLASGGCRSVRSSIVGRHRRSSGTEGSEGMTRSTLLVCALIAVLCGACGSSAPAESGKTTIAVIPKGTSHVFWQSIHAGAAKAAEELDADIIWRGPLREDDRASQVAEVEGFITRGVSGIVLAPLDEAALVGPVGDAARANIPVV